MDLLHYYEEPATPTDDSLFNFVVYDGVTEAAIDSVDTNISGDIVIPYECEVNGSIYKVGFIGDGTFDHSGITGVVIGALLKFATLYFGVVKIFIPLMGGNLKAPQIETFTTMFSTPQLITALIGGVIAIPVAMAVKRILKVQKD